MKVSYPIIYLPANTTEEAAVPTGAMVVKSGETEVKFKAAGGIESVATVSAAGWEKAQATAPNYAITRPASGASLDLHIEAGGTLAALTVMNWPVPASGVDQLRIRNFSGAAETLTAGAGWTMVTADGNPLTGGSYSIPDDRAVEVTLDPAGFAQVVPWGGEVTQAEFIAGLAGKSPTTHAHTKADVGLGSADNTSDAGKPVSTAQATAIGLKADSTALTAHAGSTSNPHGVTKAQVGLANADNTADSAKPVSTAQQTALNLKQDASAAATDAELTAHTNNVTNPHGVTKAQVGLGSTDNTSDAAKPISTATQIALDAKQAALVSGTNIRTVNGSSLVGAGNVSVAADLPGGAATTVTNEGLVTTGSPSVDTTTVPGETIIRWTGAGTFTPPIGVGNVRGLVVAGGAGGGVGVGGGGGAGGVVASDSVPVSGSTTVTIGNGGAGRSSDGAGTNGGNSVFGSVTATGGGGGGGWTAAGQNGGSGGGGNSGNSANPSVAVAGTGTTGQGNTGGVGIFPLVDGLTGGGGGGAGAGGAAGGTAQTNGVGGVGVSNDITGTAIFYGGGGGAGLYVTGATTTARLGGNGGGGTGNSTSVAATAGTVNTGGGGGGAQGFASAAGGSGVVIVRFATQTRSYQALTSYADNAAALAAGKLVGQFFRLTATGAVMQVQ